MEKPCLRLHSLLAMPREFLQHLAHCRACFEKENSHAHAVGYDFLSWWVQARSHLTKLISGDLGLASSEFTSGSLRETIRMNSKRAKRLGDSALQGPDKRTRQVGPGQNRI